VHEFKPIPVQRISYWNRELKYYLIIFQTSSNWRWSSCTIALALTNFKLLNTTKDLYKLCSNTVKNCVMHAEVKSTESGTVVKSGHW